nr:hypothetical protein [Pseudomonas protegens]
MFLVLAGNIAEAQGAGVQLEVAVVSSDQRTVDLGVVFGADIDLVLASDAGLLFNPVGLAGGLAITDRATEPRSRTKGGGDADVEFLALDLAGAGDRNDIWSPPTRPMTSSPPLLQLVSLQLLPPNLQIALKSSLARTRSISAPKTTPKSTVR